MRFPLKTSVRTESRLRNRHLRTVWRRVHGIPRRRRGPAQFP